MLSCVGLFATPSTAALQTPLSVVLPGQEYWSGLPFPSPEDLLSLRMEPGSPALQADSSPAEPGGKSSQLKTVSLEKSQLKVGMISN